jgi:hypothetical protein
MAEGGIMPKVNLDALIKREDLESISESGESSGGGMTTIKITDLKPDSLVCQTLRKPDFQRETSEWDARKVYGLIQSFVNDELIPAIILWRGKGTDTFIIDGSHRLSALAAWINDDYGDGVISKQFFDDISAEQKRFAKQTRSLINEGIGEYREYESAIRNKTAKPEISGKAKGIAVREIAVQWCKYADPKEAEAAFLKINKEAVFINDTELKLIESRKNLMRWLRVPLLAGEPGTNIGKNSMTKSREKLKNYQGVYMISYLNRRLPSH